MGWFIHCMRRYATFEGRASRAEYWWFWLFVTTGSVAGRIVAMMSPFAGGLCQVGLLIAVGVPHVAVGVRRLHDTGRSGWWLLPAMVGGFLVIVFKRRLYEIAPLAIVVVVAFFLFVILLLYFFMQPGDSRPNRFGDLAPTSPD